MENHNDRDSVSSTLGNLAIGQKDTEPIMFIKIYESVPWKRDKCYPM